MKRIAQLQRKPFARANAVDPKTGKKRYSTFAEPVKGLARTSGLERSAMKRKPRRKHKGDDPKYLTWIRSLFCLVGGPKRRCCRGKIDPHHMTGGHGDQKRGKGQTAKDRDALPVCRGHHDDFHAGRGFCRAWSKEGKRLWQEEEIIRLNRAYDQLALLAVA